MEGGAVRIGCLLLLIPVLGLAAGAGGFYYHGGVSDLIGRYRDAQSDVPQPSWVHRGNHCGPDQPALVPLAEAADAGFELPESLSERDSNGEPPALFVAIGAGRFPTGGHGLRFEAPATQRTDAEVTIAIGHRPPPAEAATTQVLTQPCGVIRIPGALADHAPVTVRYGERAWAVRWPETRKGSQGA